MENSRGSNRWKVRRRWNRRREEKQKYEKCKKKEEGRDANGDDNGVIEMEVDKGGYRKKTKEEK